MIDILSDLVTRLDAAIRGDYPDAHITVDNVSKPPSFPCIAVTEIDNRTYTRTLTQSEAENHAVTSWQIDVYTNNAVGRVGECRSAFASVDKAMQFMGMTRTYLSPTPNPADPSIYRMTGRYRATVAKDKTIYRS